MIEELISISIMGIGFITLLISSIITFKYNKYKIGEYTFPLGLVFMLLGITFGFLTLA